MKKDMDDILHDFPQEDPMIKMIKQLLPIIKELKKSKYKITLEVDAQQMEELAKLGIKWEQEE